MSLSSVCSNPAAKIVSNIRLGRRAGRAMIPAAAVDLLGRMNGLVRGGHGDGRLALARDVQLAEAILVLSGTTNGRVAVQGWQELERRTGVELADLAAERTGERISFADTQARPRAVITSPEWSGSETRRCYSPFVVNVERKKPWHTPRSVRSSGPSSWATCRAYWASSPLAPP